MVYVSRLLWLSWLFMIVYHLKWWVFFSWKGYIHNPVVIKSVSTTFNCLYFDVERTEQLWFHIQYIQTDWLLWNLVHVKRRANEKSAQRDANTARWLGGANFFAPLQTPFPGAQEGQNLISWRWSLLLPTNPVWWGSMHAISSYRGNRPTNTATNPQTNRTDYNTLHRS